MHPTKTVRRNTYSALEYDQSQFIRVVQCVAKVLPEFCAAHQADAIVVRGTSGVSMAFGLRMVLDFPTVVARKQGEASHSGFLDGVGGDMHVARYVFLDDFSCTGDTVRGVTVDMAPAVCAAVLAYRYAGPDKLPKLQNWIQLPCPYYEFG